MYKTVTEVDEYWIPIYESYFSYLTLENKKIYHQIVVDGEKDPLTFFHKSNEFLKIEKQFILKEIEYVESHPPQILKCDSQLVDQLLTINFKMDSDLLSHCLQVFKSLEDLVNTLTIQKSPKNISASIKLWIFSNIVEITNKLIFHIFCFSLASNTPKDSD